MLGLFVNIFGRPKRGSFPGADYKGFHDWLDIADASGHRLTITDTRLMSFVADRKADLARAQRDYAALVTLSETNGWDLNGPYLPSKMKRVIAQESKISEKARRAFLHPFFESAIRKRQDSGKAFTVKYVFNRMSQSTGVS